MTPHLQRLQTVVLDYIRSRGLHGATDPEIALGTGLCGDTSRARRCELRDLGQIVHSGRTRPTDSGRAAIVWVSAETELRPARTSASSSPSPPAAPVKPAAGSAACPRCGATTYRDTKIHGDRSTRRDCSRCGLFVAFTVWYGQPNTTTDRRSVDS